MLTTNDMTGVVDEQSLTHRVLRTMPLLMHFMFRQLRDFDVRIEPNQVQILSVLAEGQRTVSELAARQHVSLPSMSKTINMLVERGWVERVEVPEDRRVVRLRLTEQGRDSLRAAHQAMVHAVDEVVSHLTPEEAAALSRGLDILYSAFGSAADPCPKHRVPGNTP